MKKRIVCEKIKRPFGMHPDYGIDILENSLIYTRKVEQVPETFEEIKQRLHNDKKVFNKSVKKIEISEFMIEIHFKLQTICFLHNGDIVEPNCLRPIVINRTPAQMWQIIKSLVEE